MSPCQPKKEADKTGSKKGEQEALNCSSKQFYKKLVAGATE